MAWEVEAALSKMKNWKEAGKDQVNIETLKAGEENIAKQLAKLYTKCITERRIPKTWKEANMVIIFKKGNRKRHQEGRFADDILLCTETPQELQQMLQ